MQKPWYQSKTILLAVLQAIAGILIAVTTQYPDLELVGKVAVVKSILDIIIRLLTNSEVGKKLI